VLQNSKTPSDLAGGKSDQTGRPGGGGSKWNESPPTSKLAHGLTLGKKQGAETIKFGGGGGRNISGGRVGGHLFDPSEITVRVGMGQKAA